MASPAIIKALILEDLRHNQLLYGLEKLQINMDEHHLCLLDVIAALLGVEEVSNELGAIYLGFMQSSVESKIKPLGKNLKPIAEECYEVVLRCVELEKRLGK